MDPPSSNPCSRVAVLTCCTSSWGSCDEFPQCGGFKQEILILVVGADGPHQYCQASVSPGWKRILSLSLPVCGACWSSFTRGRVPGVSLRLRMDLCHICPWSPLAPLFPVTVFRTCLDDQGTLPIQDSYLIVSSAKALFLKKATTVTERTSWAESLEKSARPGPLLRVRLRGAVFLKPHVLFLQKIIFNVVVTWWVQLKVLGPDEGRRSPFCGVQCLGTPQAAQKRMCSSWWQQIHWLHSEPLHWLDRSCSLTHPGVSVQRGSGCWVLGSGQSFLASIWFVGFHGASSFKDSAFYSVIFTFLEEVLKAFLYFFFRPCSRESLLSTSPCPLCVQP